MPAYYVNIALSNGIKDRLLILADNEKEALSAGKRETVAILSDVKHKRPKITKLTAQLCEETLQ